MTPGRGFDEPAAEASLVPAEAAVPSMREWAEELVARARAEGLDLTGEGGLLTGLVRQVLQTGLEVELAEHLGYEPYDPSGRGSGNSRNGSSARTVTTEIGEVDLRVPRDRGGIEYWTTFPVAATGLQWVPIGP